jgi:hypothetical protein
VNKFWWKVHVRNFTIICWAGVIIAHANTVTDRRTGLTRLQDNILRSFNMRTKFYPGLFRIWIRNACKVSTATEVRFQNVAVLFVSWIVARKKDSRVSRNFRKLIGLEKFWISLTIINVCSRSLKCVATIEAVTASETSSPVVSFVRLWAPAGYILGRLKTKKLWHQWVW